MAAAVAAGNMIAHYRLVERIGNGAMGVVWSAVDTRLRRPVAIKFLPDEVAGDWRRMARFVREARAIAALNHPNIVTIYSVDEVDGRHFLTMELVQGGTLAKLIPRGGLPLEQFFDLAKPLVLAVSAAHERGITHRDLKPSNVMVGDDQRLRVLDFGLAKLQSKDTVAEAKETLDGSLTSSDHVLGTIPYVSPEQAQGRNPDQRADIFSLGTILYEMATGKRPFHGETSAELISAILRDTPPPVSRLRPEYPRQLSWVIGRCLEKQPIKRLQSALDLYNELEALEREVRTDPGEPVRSIAVLPFTDMSREKDQDYFCEGIAEEILSALTKIEGLRVASRTSAQQARARNWDVREIGVQLRVGAILDGSVRKAEDRLRIAAQLIDATDGYHLWSERYDRNVKDVFAIQDEIAQSVARALRVTLSPMEKRAIQKAPPSHVQAYDFYLRGRKFFYRLRRRDLEFARLMFSRAIKIDPQYARAYAGIADCCSFLYMFFDSSPVNREEAVKTSRKALEQDPDLAEAHASHGLALSLGLRYEEAGREFEKAIALDAGLYEAHYFYGRTCFAQGKLEQAASLFERACELNPEDYQAPAILSLVYVGLGRKTQAHIALRRALRMIEDHVELNPDDVRALYMGACLMGELDRDGECLEWAGRALALEPEEPTVLFNVGCAYTLAGKHEEALGFLERAVELGFAHKGWMQHDSNLDPLRDHPRFRALLERLE